MLERITRREEADLFVAWIAISVSFALCMIAPGGILYNLAPKVPLFTAVKFIGIALVTVGLGFIIHEMAHKYTAIAYGYWAEFRKDSIMLVVALAMAALAGIVFAAPGATVIYSRAGTGLTRKENGIISAAGPASSLLLCIPFAILFLVAGGIAGLKGGDILAQVGIAGIQINAMLATFNMLPVSILDGRKVFDWNPVAFILLLGLAVVTLYISLTFSFLS